MRTTTASRAWLGALGLLLGAACGEDDGQGGAGGDRSAIEGSRTVQGGSAVASAGAGGALSGEGNGGAPGTSGSGAAAVPACGLIEAQVLSEELPDPEVSLAGVTFGGDIAAFVDAALERRYPFGLELVRGARLETSFGDCSILFAGGAQSAEEVYESLEVIVHECGHVYDSYLSSRNRDAYELNGDLGFRCERGDTTSRGGDTFARSWIRGDEYQAQRPACGNVSRAGCDPYADVYLNGDPDDLVFQSGDQGFNLLMEEAVQYVHSVATAWAFVDQQPLNVAVSARDGILTFLWYIERYLRLARTEFPAAYARITQDECWRQLTLGVWTRAQRFLQLTRSESRLGIEDEELLQLVAQPELVDEIERLRALDDCP